MPISENIAKIFFEIVLYQETTNKLLDELEETLKEDNKILFPLRIMTSTNNCHHIIAIMEIELNEERNLTEYTEDILVKLQEYGEVRDLRVC